MRRKAGNRSSLLEPDRARERNAVVANLPTGRPDRPNSRRATDVSLAVETPRVPLRRVKRGHGVAKLYKQYSRLTGANEPGFVKWTGKQKSLSPSDTQLMTDLAKGGVGVSEAIAQAHAFIVSV